MHAASTEIGKDTNFVLLECIPSATNMVRSSQQYRQVPPGWASGPRMPLGWVGGTLDWRPAHIQTDPAWGSSHTHLPERRQPCSCPEVSYTASLTTSTCLTYTVVMISSITHYFSRDFGHFCCTQLPLPRENIVAESVVFQCITLGNERMREVNSNDIVKGAS